MWESRNRAGAARVCSAPARTGGPALTQVLQAGVPDSAPEVRIYSGVNAVRNRSTAT